MTVPEKKLTIIIVNYNTADDLKNCLQSLCGDGAGSYAHIVVVDNGGSDGSPEMVRKHFPEVQLIVSSDNFGFAGGNNLALKQAVTPFILLLNPDTIVSDNAVLKTLEFMESKPRAGIAGCRVNNPDGTIQRACRRSIPTPWVSFTHFLLLDRIFPRSPLFAKYNMTYKDYRKSHQAEAVSGSFLMIRKEVIDTIGYLDETFFMYGEELDWCYRSLCAGYEAWYYAEASIIHLKGASSKKHSRKANKAFYDAMLIFHRKHFKKKTFFLFNWTIFIGVKLLYLLSLIRMLFVRRVGSKA